MAYTLPLWLLQPPRQIKINLMTTRAKQRANKSGMEDFPWEEGPEVDYYCYYYCYTTGGETEERKLISLFMSHLQIFINLT